MTRNVKRHFRSAHIIPTLFWVRLRLAERTFCDATFDFSDALISAPDIGHPILEPPTLSIAVRSHVSNMARWDTPTDVLSIIDPDPDPDGSVATINVNVYLIGCC